MASSRPPALTPQEQWAEVNCPEHKRRAHKAPQEAKWAQVFYPASGVLAAGVVFVLPGLVLSLAEKAILAQIDKNYSNLKDKVTPETLAQVVHLLYAFGFVACVIGGLVGWAWGRSRSREIRFEGEMLFLKIHTGWALETLVTQRSLRSEDNPISNGGNGVTELDDYRERFGGREPRISAE